MEYKREELIALMREMEKQIALCHIRPQLAGVIADELERSEPVVRCRDCVYNGLDHMPHTKDKCYRLMLACFTVKPEDFCAWGRKKDGE